MVRNRRIHAEESVSSVAGYIAALLAALYVAMVSQLKSKTNANQLQSTSRYVFGERCEQLAYMLVDVSP